MRARLVLLAMVCAGLTPAAALAQDRPGGDGRDGRDAREHDRRREDSRGREMRDAAKGADRSAYAERGSNTAHEIAEARRKAREAGVTHDKGYDGSSHGSQSLPPPSSGSRGGRGRDKGRPGK